MQILNLDLETKTNSKGKFLLDCRQQVEYFLVNYSHFFIINQQLGLWLSGVEGENEFPEGGHIYGKD